MMMTTRFGRTALAVGGIGSLVCTIGCGTPASNAAPLSTATVSSTSQTGLPMVVSCAPTQRTIVRPTIVNGVAMSQVECVSDGPPLSSSVQPLSSSPVARPRPLSVPVTYPAPREAAPRTRDMREIDDMDIVPAAAGVRPPARTVRTAQVMRDDGRYDDSAVRPRRSAKKSAVIIGATSGVGAGMGAAIGGKKGALIGAVVGGGGAALWDQVTRRKQ